MANPDVVNYLRQYKNQYSIESLKVALRQQGYTDPEIEAGVQEAMRPLQTIPPIRSAPPLNSLPIVTRRNTPPVASKHSNTWIIVIVLLLLVPLILVGCLAAFSSVIFASTLGAGGLYAWLPFLAAQQSASESVSVIPEKLTKPKSTPVTITGPKNPLDFHILLEALPDTNLGPYQPGKAEGGSMTFPGDEQGEMKYSTASNEYTTPNEDDQIKISIMDSVGLESLTIILGAYGGVEYERSDGYRKKTTVQGNPSWESYNYDTREGNIMIIVKNRIYVSVEGKAPMNLLQAAANSVNYGVLENALR